MQYPSRVTLGEGVKYTYTTLQNLGVPAPQDGTMDFKQNTTSRQVSAIAVHAVRSNATVQQQQAFQVAHFRVFLILVPLYLDVQSPHESVELNNYAHNGLITTTEVAYHAYIYSQRPLTFLHVSVVNAATFITVGQVLDCLFNENGRQRYQLDATTGSGCRYWCQTVVRDMATKGWLSQDAPAKTEEIAAAIQAYNPEVVVSEVGNPRGGMFY
ncbi:uncharacterized protein C8R40DRAFT_1073674 [Lentinula edodes]|uniref:uncharacterized protein n=1 Tax=Lentinula edodes TaxID=5353 RepID=UPI001E8CDEE9|nr:uncharacterized protein C8R40DRAFT_1073674 [Lentinula edodes]KAH7869862.1 hypothetical protein C8R40DRAFT_1073674 [Lentinula edodes]